MNCYVCRVETGNGSHPALAICQRCGAGVCGAHVVEIKLISTAGMAGATKFLLICSRCYGALSQERLPHSKKPMKEKSASDKTPRRRWWNSFWRGHPLESMVPAEAVKEVERFLRQQRRQGVDHLRETDGER
jgi:hypothetical protein